MFSLSIMLYSIVNSDTVDSNDAIIAKHVLKNMYDLVDCSIVDLANQCYVSTSSVSRFCRRLGLNDFSELKMQIASYYGLKGYYKYRFDYENYEKDNYLESYIDSVSSNIMLLKQTIDEQIINELVEDLQKYQKVATFGFMQAGNVAMNLQYDLFKSNKIIYSNVNYNEHVKYIENATSDDLIIIFSHSGSYFKRLFPRMNPFKNKSNKPKIYMITSSKLENNDVDRYIRYPKSQEVVMHPYGMEVIAGAVACKYAKSEL